MQLWRPFTQHAIAPPPPIVSRAEGAYLYTADGRKIFDGISSWWVTTHGHSEPTIVAAIRAQTEKLSQTILANFTHDAANEFIAGLGAVVAPEFTHTFLSDSGSTAVEVALKMAVGAWHHRGQPQRHKIIAFEHAYHGDTIGTSSIGARGVFSRTSEPLMFEVLRVPSPADDAEKCLEELEKTLREQQNEIAAVIIEPLVQGVGGMKFYAPDVLDQITRLARAHGAFVIFDEVMTGFGRTGTLFAYQQCQELPDIMALSKGITGGFLPMGATLARQEIFDAFYDQDRARMLFYSTSYTGNALACAAAAANLQVWKQPGAIEKLFDLNQNQQACLAKLKYIQNARVCGTITAFEIEGGANNYLNNIAPMFHRFCLSRGVLLRPLGNTVYVLPPYCTTASDLEHCYDIINEFIGQRSTLSAA
jgi:adenosylmethionine-8-amino-7-oxononanoate aminotransferase